MKKNKGFVHILIIIIGVAIGLVLLGFFSTKDHKDYSFIKSVNTIKK